jgi:predicted HTH domain antitoxin
MATVTIELPDDVFATLRRSPSEFARELRLAAAVHWYSRGLISQGKGAEIAGLSRRAFLAELGKAQVEACQVEPEELE